MSSLITVTVRYFAKLREERGISEETLKVVSVNVRQLYDDLKGQYSLSLPVTMMRAAVNREFVSWDYVLKEGDEVTFIPPVSGG